MKIHYAGEIRDHRGTMLAGWSACCSGDRAVKIRATGNHTYNPSDVTCIACLRRLDSHFKYAASKSTGAT